MLVTANRYSFYTRDAVTTENCGGMRLIRQLVAAFHFEISDKVRVFIGEGYYEVEDLQCCIATGRVKKKQKDEYRKAIDGSKYVICGSDRAGNAFYCCGKILRSSAGKYFFFITAHEEGIDYDKA